VHDGRRFTVASMEDRRITRVRVEPVAASSTDEEPLPIKAQPSLFDERQIPADASSVMEPYIETELRSITNRGKNNDGKGSA